MVNKHSAIVNVQAADYWCTSNRYTKVQAHLHQLPYFPVSPWSWRTSCDIMLLEVQPLWLYSLWAGINLPACWLPSWVVISCRLPVQLWEGQPCIQHQTRTLSHQAPLCHFGWQHSTWPVWMHLTTRTGQFLLRRTPDHCSGLWTHSGWCGQVLPRQCSAKPWYHKILIS